MKKSFLFSLLTLPLLLAACSVTTSENSTSNDPLSESNETTLVEVSEEGYTTVNNSELNNLFAVNAASDLSESEKESLLYMREEEKLAHDLYLDLYELWGQNSFNNIAQSEASHMAAVKSLLDLYGLDDPAAQTGRGEFENEALQDLYNTLKAQGETSLVEALKVGAMVEEVDIVDLQRALQDTSNENIILVYENLMKGSRNHLRAYVNQLKRQGVDYSPQYLNQQDYETIVGGDMERGGQGAGRGR